MGASILIRGHEALKGDHPGLVFATYLDTETTTNEAGLQEVWPGKRPLLDAMVIIPQPQLMADTGETHLVPTPMMLHKIPWNEDLREQFVKYGTPMGLFEFAPRYLVIKKIEAR